MCGGRALFVDVPGSSEADLNEDFGGLMSENLIHELRSIRLVVTRREVVEIDDDEDEALRALRRDLLPGIRHGSAELVQKPFRKSVIHREVEYLLLFAFAAVNLVFRYAHRLDFAETLLSMFPIRDVGARLSVFGLYADVRTSLTHQVLVGKRIIELVEEALLELPGAVISKMLHSLVLSSRHDD